MIVEDVLYGSFEIEAVLADLILSKEVQRLKDVHMAGPAFLINSTWNETRYEHSLGVMLLIRKLGGSIEEQIAGLLHDVSHTAFSHVVDLALANEADDYHEKIKQRILEASSIPEVLKKYGYDYQKLLLNDEQWGLLEQEAPLLCCDRIDYTLREVYRYFSVSIDEIHQFLTAIKIISGKIVLESIDWAEWFIDQYKKIVIDFFYDPRNIFSYEWMAQIIQLGLANNSLTKTDLLMADNQFLATLKLINSDKIQKLLEKINQPPNYTVVSSNEEYDIFQKKKLRLVDPLVEVNDEVIPVSKVSSDVRKKIGKMRFSSEKGIYLKLT